MIKYFDLYYINYIINSSEIKKMIRKFFTNFDMFGASPNLRMRGQSETINLCGGIASLLILLFFVYIFILEGLQIINFDAI